MNSLTLALSRIRAGFWEGMLEGGTGVAPRIEVIHRERPLAGLEMTGANGRWAARAPIPADILSDGIHTFLIRDKDSGHQLGSFTIAAGDTLDGNLQAEVELLRAELDMLKKAFRRHCLETGGG